MRRSDMLYEVICITPFGMEAQNSASDLARQICGGISPVLDVATRRNGRASRLDIIKALMQVQRLGGSQTTKLTIYYQLSDPISIILVYMLSVLTGACLIVHVLDNFIETAKYRRFFAIPRMLAVFMMRRADQLLTISPAMKDEFSNSYGLSSQTAFRWRPVQPRERKRPTNGRILFGGAINDRTNFTALTEFAHSLERRSDKKHLDVYTRGGNSILATLPNVTIKPPVDEESFVNIAADYDAFLVPFNHDSESFSFYRDSCPSKASTLFAAQIPILVYGPYEFWFLEFLADYPFVTSSIDALSASHYVEPTEYVRANQALGEQCEVYTLLDLQ
ncbi:MAG: glycosyltransferase family 4 protein [Sphingomonadales bacterium]|nr:glycosyltransferase family 4 protein [Sphingomonadales bacterium]NCO50024.1 glycosyltransferase family 4 protein [Sphingomonadales bacterium]